ncbi:MAG: hypothetical protein JWM47_1526 [Acidimicrobiales bacterium]|nr:hypothetical protein [Acidimicrobiales bacterium]
MTGRRTVGILGVAALLVLGSGCGKVAEKAAEKATEKAIEDQTGGDAKVDLDSGKVKVDDGRGGTMEVDGNGNLEVTDKDGNTSVSSGDGTGLPAGWPEELDPPEGTKIITASSTDGALSVSGTLDASVREVLDGLKAQLTGAGYEISGDNFGEASGTSYGNITATGDDYVVSATVGDGGASTDGTFVTISLDPRG